ncbi:glycosyltransferase family protein [Algivirga pacifica]|uniref:Spore protein YkvP/CgeB glycosyl transferase-like domain-containing protein n=1 Tax=Algivirga pacifica TaxID=1162670 RepID=A0ABP9DKU9_9BACT
MTLKNKVILLISPEAWGKSFVSKHHYAKTLAERGNKVYFLNPPTSKEEVISVSDNLYIINKPLKFRGIGRLPNWLGAILTKWELQVVEQLIGEEVNIIWNFDSSRFFNLSRIKKPFKICHIVDMAENIHRDLLATTSDICFCTSDFIKQELQPDNDHVYKIHHGYQESRNNYQLEESFDQHKIQVGYVGNLSRFCIDWKIILQLIKEYPDIDFNFIGSYTISNLSRETLLKEYMEELQRASNVRLLGPKESYLIPSYLSKMDVLLSVYKMDTEGDIKQHSNLHKTMEYLGSGKVIVSSYSDEYKDYPELLIMSKKNEELLEKFREVVSDIRTYNSSEKEHLRRLFVENHTYSKQLDKIERIIDNHLS